MESKKYPVLKKINNKYSIYSSVEIIDISYDLWTLRISLRCTDLNYPIYISLKGVIGYRVLDEGDLTDYWITQNEKYWIYEILKNGWMDQEKERSAFISGNRSDISEYLISGINECINVLATDKPIIYAGN